MATINCPHCGKEMFEMLDTCPHCGGPVVSEALNKEVKRNIAEISRQVNQKEKVWLFLSIIAGIMFAFSSYEKIGGPSELRPDFVPQWVETVLQCLFFFLPGAWVVYGAHYLHIVRRGLDFISRYGLIICLLFAIIIFVFALMACLMVGFFTFPIALFRFLIHKPLLSDNEVMSLVNKGLVNVD